MTQFQKQLIRYLLDQAYSYGFDDTVPLGKIAEKFSVGPEIIYNPDGMDGALWEFGDQWGSALVLVCEGRGTFSFQINFDMKELAEAWSAPDIKPSDSEYGNPSFQKPEERSRATELEYFKWFRINADFGPAEADVIEALDGRFMDETGKNLPEGWNLAQDGETIIDRV